MSGLADEIIGHAIPFLYNDELRVVFFLTHDHSDTNTSKPIEGLVGSDDVGIERFPVSRGRSFKKAVVDRIAKSVFWVGGSRGSVDRDRNDGSKIGDRIAMRHAALDRLITQGLGPAGC